LYLSTTPFFDRKPLLYDIFHVFIFFASDIFCLQPPPG